MYVGILKVAARLPGAQTLKDKRSVVKSVLERAQHRFKAAAAEVGRLDNPRQAELGFAVVANDAAHAERVLDSVLRFVDGSGELEVTERSTEIISS